MTSNFEVRGIPALVVLRPDGSVIDKDGRGSVAGANGKFPDKWC